MVGCRTYGEYVAQARAQNKAIKATLDYLNSTQVENEVSPEDAMLARAASVQKVGVLGIMLTGGVVIAGFSKARKAPFLLIAALPAINVGAREGWYQDNVSRYLTLKYSQILRRFT